MATFRAAGVEKAPEMPTFAEYRKEMDDALEAEPERVDGRRLVLLRALGVAA